MVEIMLEVWTLEVRHGYLMYVVHASEQADKSEIGGWLNVIACTHPPTYVQTPKLFLVCPTLLTSRVVFGDLHREIYIYSPFDLFYGFTPPSGLFSETGKFRNPNRIVALASIDSPLIKAMNRSRMLTLLHCIHPPPDHSQPPVLDNILQRP
jgi:hypothetical protein